MKVSPKVHDSANTVFNILGCASFGYFCFGGPGTLAASIAVGYLAAQIQNVIRRMDEAKSAPQP